MNPSEQFYYDVTSVLFMGIILFAFVAGAPVPGQIQAEDYDAGGPGIGYFDTTPGNLGGAAGLGEAGRRRQRVPLPSRLQDGADRRPSAPLRRPFGAAIRPWKWLG